MTAQDDQKDPISLANLKPGMKLDGTITRLELYGAFAEVGAETEGLIHISKLGKKRITRVQDAVEVGDQVEVWVEQVDPAAKRLELTLRQPLELPWGKLKQGMTVSGTVTRLERFGAFVEIGAERPGLVHVSEMGAGYVSSPAEVVSVGEEVEVTILEIDRSKKQIRLSMKSPLEELEAEEEEEEELPTAMELALRQAMEGSESIKSATQPTETAKRRGKRSEQEDLLARTLSQRVRTSTDTEE